MIIPKLHYISEGKTPEIHLENIQKACTSGIELVLLNLQNISDKKYFKIATEAREITGHFQTRLMINENFKVAKEVKADGVHFHKSNANFTNARIHIYTWQMIGATANTLKDCESLVKNSVDYITLAPFKGSSEEKTVLGLKGFSLLIDSLKTETPIIGFGEITTDDVTNILETGVSGIAVSEEITQNFDSIRGFNKLLNASSTQELRHEFK